MFIIGTGKVLALTPPIYLYNDCPDTIEAAFAAANETPKIALAPNLDLFSEPSNAIITLSSLF